MRRILALSLAVAGTIPASIVAQDRGVTRLDSMVVDGVMRHWVMYVPPSYEAGSPMALVLDFHGSGGTPASQEASSQFHPLAATEGFLVAGPAGAYRLGGGATVSWNVDLTPGTVDDVNFVRQLIRRISRDYSVRADQVYATGMSGGARMSSRLGCDLSDMIAAIGPVAGVQYPSGCSPSRPVPVVTFHGRKDPQNTYELQPDSPPFWHMGVEEALAGWIANASCATTPTQQPITADVTRLWYSQCGGTADVVFYRSEDAGHTWPGSPTEVAEVRSQRGLGATDLDLPATRLIWEFFKSHRLR